MSQVCPSTSCNQPGVNVNSSRWKPGLTQARAQCINCCWRVTGLKISIWEALNLVDIENCEHAKRLPCSTST
eukprot:6176282-Pleurochrysis_carterae.AAC.1